MMRPIERAVPADELTPAAFERRRRSAELWQLLDVREAWELGLAELPGAVHIPMSEIPDRHVELDRNQPVAVLCHSGVRSARVAAYLLELGFETRSVLASPIRGGGKVLGVIEVLNKRDGTLFSHHDLTLLSLMCRFSGELLHSLIRQSLDAR